MKVRRASEWRQGFLAVTIIPGATRFHLFRSKSFGIHFGQSVVHAVKSCLNEVRTPEKNVSQLQ